MHEHYTLDIILYTQFLSSTVRLFRNSRKHLLGVGSK